VYPGLEPSSNQALGTRKSLGAARPLAPKSNQNQVLVVLAKCVE